MKRMRDVSPDVTALLLRWGQGDGGAMDELMPLVCEELHRMARHYMAGERATHTLQPTALVNEVYLRLVNVRQVGWKDRAHFFAMSARVMRRVLVDFARAHRYQKRGGGVSFVTFDEELAVSDESAAGVVALDDALGALAQIDERKSRVIELRAPRWRCRVSAIRHGSVERPRDNSPRPFAESNRDKMNRCVVVRDVASEGASIDGRLADATDRQWLAGSAPARPAMQATATARTATTHGQPGGSACWNERGR
jgi:RNA polymerase sigma factor (TIGR02999 family)